VRNLQPADERKCRDIFTVVGNIGELILKAADVRLEVVAVSHFDGKNMVILLGLPA